MPNSGNNLADEIFCTGRSGLIVLIRVLLSFSYTLLNRNIINAEVGMSAWRLPFHA